MYSTVLLPSSPLSFNNPLPLRLIYYTKTLTNAIRCDRSYALRIHILRRILTLLAIESALVVSSGTSGTAESFVFPIIPTGFGDGVANVSGPGNTESAVLVPGAVEQRRGLGRSPATRVPSALAVTLIE